jgi:hypothetical protein
MLAGAARGSEFDRIVADEVFKD